MCLDTGLRGAHAIITGGTRGMGQVIVQALLKEGVNVSYCARIVGENHEYGYANGTEQGFEAQAVGTAVDVSSKEHLQHWVDEAAARFGRLDIVIANGPPLPFPIPYRKPTFSLITSIPHEHGRQHRVLALRLRRRRYGLR